VLNRRLTLSTTFTILAAAYLLLTSVIAVLLAAALEEPWWAILIAPAVLLPFLYYHVRRAFAPMRSKATFPAPTSWNDTASRAGTIRATSPGVVGPSDAEPQPSTPPISTMEVTKARRCLR
jgi:hypothetical protein